jgi:acyl-CoA dehydrogenase
LNMLDDYAKYDNAIGLNFYDLDPNLELLFERLLKDPQEIENAKSICKKFGETVGTKIAERAETTDKNGPVLQKFDRWGYETNEVIHHQNWILNKADLIKLGYLSSTDMPGIVRAAINYIVCQAETALICALGMTNAAADIIERYGPETKKKEMVEKLRSKEPAYAWEGGMFLTERQGGSDVGANTTRAVVDGDEWRLYGDKFFCSNVDADVFIVLARPEGAPAGSRGLASFIVPRKIDGKDNGFQIKRLKPKMGTVGVPTGEVHLEGSYAYLVKPPNLHEDSASKEAELSKGINKMMEMVNASRFGVALMGLGIHRRSFLEAAIYAANRSQFGNRIDSYPMVRETLVDILVDLEAGMAITFECAAADRFMKDPREAMAYRRILIPLAKIRSTRRGLWAASNALEIFGGNGYMNDWPMARQLRDAQCHPIWEGTENICSIDVRRAMRSTQSHEVLFEHLKNTMSQINEPYLKELSDKVMSVIEVALKMVSQVLGEDDRLSLFQLRTFSNLLADICEAVFLLQEAQFWLDKDGNWRKALIASRFVKKYLSPDRYELMLEPDISPVLHFEPLIRFGSIKQI